LYTRGKLRHQSHPSSTYEHLVGGLPISTIRWIAITAALHLALAIPASARTHQIVQNGGFETDVSGWTVNQGALRHTTATVRAGSGAAQTIIHSQWDASDVVQCADVSALVETWPASNGKKQLTLSGYVNTNATTVSLIRLEAHFYADPSCSESLQWQPTPSVPSPTDGWAPVSGTATIPPRTKSIAIHLYAEGAGGESVYWDDIMAYSDSDTGLVNEVEDVERLAPIVLPICVAIAAFGLFGLLGLMKRGRR
jgi:hypothetical protein